MSFYLKYRPQKTSDLDLETVRKFYSNILKSGKFSHAYLFSGPRGTGKTSSARILAKIINCEKNVRAIKNSTSLNEPCNKCDMCNRITSGSSLSVVEMDAASNRGIDDIRALREKISLTPAEGQFIVYIIDEVHMLTTEAFNALLKTLEEPPGHAVFALCTTEFHKLPQTIVSRCTQVLYPKATPNEVKSSLNKVIKGEKINISDASLDLLSESVDGSFRDALKMLEQLSLAGEKISDEDVASLVNKSSLYDSKPFIEHLIKKDVKTCMSTLSNLEQMGVDFSVYSKRILEELRTMLLSEINDPKGLDSTLISLIEIISKSSMDIKSSFLPQLPLEIATAQWCLSSQKNAPTPNTNIKSLAPTQVAPSQIHKSPQPTKTTPYQPKKSPPIPQKPKTNYSTKDLDHSQVIARWDEVLSGIKPLNHSLEALLRASKPIQTEGSAITIEVFYKFHKERLEQDKHRFAIEQVISDMFNSKVSLVFVLGEGAPTPKKAPKPESTPKDSDLAKAAEEIFS